MKDSSVNMFLFACVCAFLLLLADYRICRKLGILPLLLNYLSFVNFTRISFWHDNQSPFNWLSIRFSMLGPDQACKIWTSLCSGTSSLKMYDSDMFPTEWLTKSQCIECLETLAFQTSVSYQRIVSLRTHVRCIHQSIIVYEVSLHLVWY